MMMIDSSRPLKGKTKKEQLEQLVRARILREVEEYSVTMEE